MNKNGLKFKLQQLIKQERQMSLQKMIDLMYAGLNKVRTQPQVEAAHYENAMGLYNGLIYRQNVKTREGVNAVQNLVTELRQRPAIERRLKWSFALHMAADEQAIKLGDNGLTTTDGTKLHVPLPTRCKQYGVIRGRLTQVYQFGGNSAEEILQCLLIDDGLASRKRRKTLLDPIYNYVGIGTSYHEKYGTVTVIILAEDVISLVMPGDEGNYFKRQTLPQGEVYTFDIEEEKQNQRRQIMEQRSSFMGNNTSFDSSKNNPVPSQQQRVHHQNSLRNDNLPEVRRNNGDSNCVIF